MFALVIWAFLLGYLAIAITVTVGVVYLARSAGVPRSSRWLAGALVATVFYLIPFWDWIPTVVAHRYYCGKDASFVVNKTIDQWKKENAEVLPSLRHDPRALFTQVGEYEQFPLNERLASQQKTTTVFLTVKREDGRVIDLKTAEVLARYSDFRAGYAPLAVGGEGAWKFWLKRDGCGEELHGPRASLVAYRIELTKDAKEIR